MISLIVFQAHTSDFLVRSDSERFLYFALFDLEEGAFDSVLVGQLYSTQPICIVFQLIIEGRQLQVVLNGEEIELLKVFRLWPLVIPLPVRILVHVKA